MSNDMSGPHAFAEDDSHQFIDVWHNDNGNVTIKASNGKQWSPMWVVAHVIFSSGGSNVAAKDYHVYCQSPQPGGGGKERWFVFNGPGVESDSLTASTVREKPWTKPDDGWEFTKDWTFPI